MSGLLFVVFFFLALFVLSPLRDSDSCWLIQTGRWMLSHGAIPMHNPFGAPYLELSRVPIVCYQWLFECLLGLADWWLGLSGVLVLVAFLLGMTGAQLVLWLYERGFKGMPTILVAILLGFPLLFLFALARPMLLSLLFTVILLRWLWQPGATRVAWVLFPLLFVVWANAHLAFTGGLVILGVYQLERAVRERSLRPLALVGLCLLATLLNPYGGMLYAYQWQLAHSPYMNSQISELRPIPLNEPYIVFYLLLVCSAYVAAFRDARITWAERFLFLASLLACIYFFRNYYLLCLMSLPFLAVCVERFQWLQEKAGARAARFSLATERPFFWILASLLSGLFLAGLNLLPVTLPQQACLSGVVRYLNRHPLPQPILTREDWGSYLIRLSSARSYLDSRMDMYGDAYVRDYHIAYGMNAGWQAIFRTRRIHYLLYPRTALAPRYFQRILQWRPLYQDASVILIAAPGA